MKRTFHATPYSVSMYDRLSIATCTLILGLSFIAGLSWFRETVISEAGRTSVAVAIMVMTGFTVFNFFSMLFGRRDRELGKLKQQLRIFLKNA